MAEIWTSFDYKTEREEDRSSPILGVPMRLRKHLSGLRNAFKKWTYKKQTHGWLDLTGERYGRLLVLGPWKEDSPYLDMVKDGNAGMDGGNKGANAEKQYYDTFLKKYHGEQSGAESEGRE